MQFIASVIWSAWAIYLVEVPIIVPNVLGVVFAAIQIALWVWASKQEKRINAGGGGGATAIGGDFEFEGIGATQVPTKVTSRRPSAEGLDGQVLDEENVRGLPRKAMGI